MMSLVWSSVSGSFRSRATIAQSSKRLFNRCGSIRTGSPKDRGMFSLHSMMHSSMESIPTNKLSFCYFKEPILHCSMWVSIDVRLIGRGLFPKNWRFSNICYRVVKNWERWSWSIATYDQATYFSCSISIAMFWEISQQQEKVMNTKKTTLWLCMEFRHWPLSHFRISLLKKLM
jgi:hypothetical protein